MIFKNAVQPTMSISTVFPFGEDCHLSQVLTDWFEMKLSCIAVMYINSSV